MESETSTPFNKRRALWRI
jgi:hypothetical protein